MTKRSAAPGAAPAGLSPIALAAILTGVGVVMLGFFIGLVVLLFRAVRTHKRLLADLEERGVEIAQARDSKRPSITKPRAVLRRNTILPFNKSSGWGTLTSAETINTSETPPIPPHYAPPKPTEAVSKPNRLSWPFPTRRTSGKAIGLRKLQVPILSTVIESPKPSPLVPVLSSSLGYTGMSTQKNPNSLFSDHSLLQHHPAFRVSSQEGKPESYSALRSDSLRRSLTTKPANRTEALVRPNRSNSVAEISLNVGTEDLFKNAHPPPHTRSASMCSQASGNAPNALVPPLPLEVVRVKSEARRRSLLSRSPSQISISSFESAGSSILATQSSPILPRPNNVRVQKVTRRDWKTTAIIGPRPLRDTLILHGKNQRSQGSIRSSVAQLSTDTSSMTEQSQAQNISPNRPNSPTSQAFMPSATGSAALRKVYTPTGSPLAVRSLNATPRRKSGSHVSANGSPEERQLTSLILCDVSGNFGAPNRQLSQASTRPSSTRSSNGNPFQWDPAPLSSGKPSALKGSPSARKGHRRRNCVRISLDPTVLGPSTRSPSPSTMNDIQEESPNATADNRPNTSAGCPPTRSLPRPPSTSTFAPDLNFTATSIRASLTPSSPTLSMANFDQGHSESSINRNQQHNSAGTMTPRSKRSSLGSNISIPSFPSPCHGTRSAASIASPPAAFALFRLSNDSVAGTGTSDTRATSPSPFEVLLRGQASIREKPLSVDEYDPEHPSLIYQTQNSSFLDDRPTRPCYMVSNRRSSSGPQTMPEESQLEDSPPCSPKTDRPNPFLSLGQSTYSKSSTDLIDPAILSQDRSSKTNDGVGKSRSDDDILPTTKSSLDKISPMSAESAKSIFDPLLEAAFPTDPLVQQGKKTGSCTPEGLPILNAEPPTISIHPSSSSVCSSPASSPIFLPCSPRPAHAQLPAPALNFVDMPMLSPFARNSQNSLPRSLRTSIQTLRRMNSDADSERGCKAERRYLKLGRRESLCSAGEDTWLEDHEIHSDDNITVIDEEHPMDPVGEVLDSWEEEATMLQLENEEEEVPDRNKSTKPTNKHGPASDGKHETKRPSLPPTLSPKPSINNNINRASNIWEDGEKFWRSNPVSPTSSLNEDTIMPFSSSPLAASTPPPSFKPMNRKRDFEVAKDDPDPQSPIRESENKHSPGIPRKMAGTRNWKRDALGVSTANARVHVSTQPQGNVHGTPGSLYDNDGFLRA